jgi:hypothetical protein
VTGVRARPDGGGPRSDLNARTRLFLNSRGPGEGDSPGLLFVRVSVRSCELAARLQAFLEQLMRCTCCGARGCCWKSTQASAGELLLRSQGVGLTVPVFQGKTHTAAPRRNVAGLFRPRVFAPLA